MELSDQISSDLNIPSSLIDEAIQYAHQKIRKIHVPKRNGGTRTISLPYNKVKTIQYWLIHNVFNKLPIHSSALAYKKGTSTLENAKRHKDNKYFVKLDLKDFFPSIKFGDIVPVIKSWHSNNKISWELNDNALLLINRCCFDQSGCLPIGYSSSPSICNAVMFNFDIAISKTLINKDSYGKVIYTRYADDLIFSTNKSNVCKKILKVAEKVIKDSKSPKLTINHDKTGFASSTGGTALVTGLRVCSGGHITIHKKYKDHIRLHLSLYQKGTLDASEFESLRGHLSYIKHVEPAFYTKMQNKYFHAIQKLFLL